MYIPLSVACAGIGVLFIAEWCRCYTEERRLGSGSGHDLGEFQRQCVSPMRHRTWPSHRRVWLLCLSLIDFLLDFTCRGAGTIFLLVGQAPPFPSPSTPLPFFSFRHFHFPSPSLPRSLEVVPYSPFPPFPSFMSPSLSVSFFSLFLISSILTYAIWGWAKIEFGTL